MRLPTGTVTFLFTDIEGSTQLWERYPEAMRTALARHDVLLHESIAASEGAVFKTMGDAFCSVFASAPAALTAALTAQIALQNEPWPEEVPVRVRMALHTGLADERDGDYFGPPLNRVTRLLSTGHGRQTLLSQSTYELTRDSLPLGATLSDLGAHSLRDLARPEQVYQLGQPGLQSEFPALKSLDSLPNNLPRQVTSFVGREKELIKIKTLLDKTDLLTLTGSGGSGKTRISIQAAADVLDKFPDGVWLVELAPITDPELVPYSVGQVLGLTEQPGKSMTQMLADSLKAKTLLLVLDNCEHVLTACAKLADTLVRNCPQIKILASSREALNVPGEQTYRVPSLSLPDAKVIQTAESLSQYEGVRLFIERAALVKSDFAVTNANAPALASGCHRVDGIPLAIELAAARIRSLSVEEINARLDNRFRLLTGGSKTALPRQQTLRALIDWSYGLLTEQEKVLLRRLSVFVGGWTLAAAEAVCVGEDIEDWEVLDLLTSLVDKSLVNADEADGATRYRFLETVRQYARDRLAEGDSGIHVREHHRDYFLALAEEVRPHLEGSQQSRCYSLLETEHDNLRQAITFCLDDPDGAEKGLRLGGALSWFWWGRGHLGEERERLTALLSRSEAQARTQPRAAALIGAGNLAVGQGDRTQARIYLEESLAISRELEDRRGIANALLWMGRVATDQNAFELARSQVEESLAIYRELEDRNDIAYSLAELGAIVSYLSDYAMARSLLQESLALFRELGNKNSISACLMYLGSVAERQGEYESARSLHEESLAIFQEIGNKLGVADALNRLGYIATEQGNNGDAWVWYEECLALYRESGTKPRIASVLRRLGYIATEQGDFASARSQYRESLALFREMDDHRGVAFMLGAFAALVARDGSAEGASRLFGASEALREAISVPLELSELREYDQGVATVQTALGEDGFAAAWAAGRAMTWEQAVEFALEE